MPPAPQRILISGDAAERLTVVEGDIRQADDLDRAFSALGAQGPIEAVVASAGLNDGAGWRLARLRTFSPQGYKPQPCQ
jgi:hypothetical protein